MPALYRSADVILHLSKEESFGNVFLEAMACGLPIVGHDSPRLRWIVGDDEFLLNTENLPDVAAAIERANQSPARLRESRIHRAKDFAWSRIAGEYRAFFEEVISAGRARRACSSE
jgi:glycosyltransferase involved in cell wall biosynthesis